MRKTSDAWEAELWRFIGGLSDALRDSQDVESLNRMGRAWKAMVAHDPGASAGVRRLFMEIEAGLSSGGLGAVLDDADARATAEMWAELGLD